MSNLVFDSRTGKYYQITPVEVQTIGGERGVVSGYTDGVQVSPATQTITNQQPPQIYHQSAIPAQQTVSQVTIPVNTQPQGIYPTYNPSNQHMINVQNSTQPVQPNIEELMGEWLSPNYTDLSTKSNSFAGSSLEIPK